MSRTISRVAVPNHLTPRMSRTISRLTVLDHLRELLLHVEVGGLALHDPPLPEGGARGDAAGADLGGGVELEVPGPGLRGGLGAQPGSARLHAGVVGRRPGLRAADHGAPGPGRRAGRPGAGAGGGGGKRLLPRLHLGVDEDGLLGGVQLLVVGGLRELAGSALPLRAEALPLGLGLGETEGGGGGGGGRPGRLLGLPDLGRWPPVRTAARRALELDGGAGLGRVLVLVLVLVLVVGVVVLDADDVSQGGVAGVTQLLQLVLGQAARRDAVDLGRTDNEVVLDALGV